MRFISFDLETTGFISGVDQIVEIGAVRYINGEPDAVFATLIDPKIQIPEGASRVNGITDQMVTGNSLSIVFCQILRSSAAMILSWPIMLPSITSS